MTASVQQKTHASEQIAMFTAAREAVTHGRVDRDGVAHPTWEELGPMGQEAYLSEAVATVAAMCALGWEPKQ